MVGVPEYTPFGFQGVPVGDTLQMPNHDASGLVGPFSR